MKYKPFVIGLLSAVGIIASLQALDIVAEHKITDNLTALQTSIQTQMPGSRLHWSWVSASGFPYNPKIIIRGLKISHPNSHEYIGFTTISAKPFTGITNPLVVTNLRLNAVIARTADSRVNLTAREIDFGDAHWAIPSPQPGETVSAISIARSFNNKSFAANTVNADISGETGHFTGTVENLSYSTAKPDVLSAQLKNAAFIMHNPSDVPEGPQLTPIASISIGTLSIGDMPYKHLLGLSQALPLIRHTPNTALALQIAKKVTSVALNLEEKDIQDCLQAHACTIANDLGDLSIRSGDVTIFSIADTSSTTTLDKTGLRTVSNLSATIDTTFASHYLSAIPNIGKFDFSLHEDATHNPSDPDNYKIHDLSLHMPNFGDLELASTYSVKENPAGTFADNTMISSVTGWFKDLGLFGRMMAGQTPDTIDSIALPNDLTDTNKEAVRNWLKETSDGQLFFSLKPDHAISITDIQAGITDPSWLTVRSFPVKLNNANPLAPGSQTYMGLTD